MQKLKSIFSLEVDDLEFTTDLTQFELKSDEADQDAMTFLDYNSGVNRAWTLTVTSAFDGGSVGSLHSYLWDHSGSTTQFKLQPISGAASLSKPQYIGDIRIPYKPDLVVEAGSESTFEYEFEVIGQPVKVVDGDTLNLYLPLYDSFY
ncbi:major tail protein [Rhodococcus phage Weasels2]|uniref:Major tail protein n=1 Tax=Rhodococcus phage Weasels2 TaxID=1897437 RepID=A0A1I9SA53_9CAUD|nr:major tail protein [Rhodococcus phage Weasels2]AOZ63659.1 major tail protein [Rhodococcus phage Weasels2]